MLDDAIETLFKNKKLDEQKLRRFGFSGTGGKYTYAADLSDGQFKLTVSVSKNGQISTELVETAFNEPYTLHLVPAARGSFIGKIKEQYERVLSSIADACFEKDIFKSDCARKVIQYIRKQYNDEPEFLWEKFSNNAIFRRQDNEKWYAALLIIPKSKLGLAGEDPVDIIDLRGGPAGMDSLIDGKRYFPGWHMNKKHWFTIVLDGSVPVKEICRRIDASREIAKK